MPAQEEGGGVDAGGEMVWQPLVNNVGEKWQLLFIVHVNHLSCEMSKQPFLQCISSMHNEFICQVCEDRNSQPEVFCLAMNYFDRFLGVCSVDKTQLQLLGAVCLLVAFKVSHPTFF